MFNAHYSWLILAEEWTEIKSTMDHMNINVNTDAVVILPNGSMLDVYKIQHSMPLIYNGPFYEFSSKRKPVYDFMGYTVKSYLVNSALSFDVSGLHNSLGLLINRTFRPEEVPTGRFTALMVDLAIQSLNMTYEIVQIESFYGPDGMYSKIKMDSSDVELVFMVAIMTQERIDFLSFVPVSIDVRFSFYFLSPLAFGTSSALIKPFSASVWKSFIFSIITTVVICVFFFIFEKRKSIKGFPAALEYAAAIYSHQGHSEDIKLDGTKVISLFLNILSFMFLTYYSNMVLTGLLAPSPKETYSLQKLTDSKMEFGVLDVGYLRNLEYTSVYGPDSPARRSWIKKVRKQKNLFYDLSTGAHKMLKGGFALYGDDLGMKVALSSTLRDREACALTLAYIAPKFNPVFPVKKGSFLLEAFSAKMIWTWEVGMRRFAHDAFLPPIPPCLGGPDIVGIGTTALLLAYSVLTSGIVTAILLFIIELTSNWLLKKPSL